MTLSFITWQFNPEIIELPFLSPRWYGLLFAVAFFLGYWLLQRIYRREKVDQKYLDKLTYYMVIGTIVGARLGHVFFYGPLFTDDGTGYLQDPISILNIREGGLASHGAAIGILLALYLYIRRSGIQKNFMWIVDRIVIAVAIGGAFVRIGNFANSEIIGKPTDLPFGVVFLSNATEYFKDFQNEDEAFKSFEFHQTDEDTVIDGTTCRIYNLNISYAENEMATSFFVNTRIAGVLSGGHWYFDHTRFTPKQDYHITDNNGVSQLTLRVPAIPRHPAQLYEAFAYILVFLMLFGVYQKHGALTRPGLLFGIFLSGVFTARFLIEFVKENQVSFEDNLKLNMGQNLSIPFVLLGIFFIIRAYRKSPDNAS